MILAKHLYERALKPGLINPFTYHDLANRECCKVCKGRQNDSAGNLKQISMSRFVYSGKVYSNSVIAADSIDTKSGPNYKIIKLLYAAYV